MSIFEQSLHFYFISYKHILEMELLEKGKDSIFFYHFGIFLASALCIEDL